MNESAAKFKPGERVRVRVEDRSGHIRTPWYIRGKTGSVQRIHGEFLNPESLGHGGDGLPKKILYSVEFQQGEVWERYHVTQDRLVVDIFEHWLDPAN